MRKLKEVLVEERRARRRERANMLTDCAEMEKKLNSLTLELRKSEESLKILQMKDEQVSAISNFEKQSKSTSERSLRDLISQLEVERNSLLTNLQNVKIKYDSMLAEKDSIIAKANSTLELKTREWEVEMELASRNNSQKIDSETRKLQSKYQYEIDSKLSGKLLFFYFDYI